MMCFVFCFLFGNFLRGMSFIVRDCRLLVAVRKLLFDGTMMIALLLFVILTVIVFFCYVIVFVEMYGHIFLLDH